MKVDIFNKISGQNEKKIESLAAAAERSTQIEGELFTKYDVKRGLRDINGKGVLCGLTKISDIISFKKMPDGTENPCEGELYYRGIDIRDIVKNVEKRRFGFEETVYLLLFGKLPSQKDLKSFISLLAAFRDLPKSFVRDVIMKAPSRDIMNALSRSVLTLYSYDEKPDDISIYNILRQVLQLTARFPLLAVYCYNSFNHFYNDKSLIIHKPQKNLSCAENILYMLREDSSFTPLEAHILDICLILHAEHGGGNNSTFTTHVVSSSGTDTYSVVSASLGSLKGPRHGGANIKVAQMFDDLKSTLKKYDESTVSDYLAKLLDKQGFDKSGLIYGMGHAVYSLSDPRADILRDYVGLLAKEKGREEDYKIYEMVERLAPQIIAEKRKIYKGVAANVDFYSGLVYNILGLPNELFTPMFAIARIVGWGAHRIEEIGNNGKIIRPAYKAVSDKEEYVKINKRK